MERHRAKKTKKKIFCLGWAVILAIGLLFFNNRPLHIAETIVCWSVLALITFFFIGMMIEAVLSLIIKRLNYQVCADKRALTVLWRNGKGNLGFPRKAMRRVFYQVEKKTGEGFIGICLRKELLEQVGPEAEKFFAKFRKRYNCEYALTARQIGGSEHIRKLVNFMRGSAAKVRVENTDNILPPPAKRLPTWILALCGLMYPLAFYILFALNNTPAAK